MQSSFNVIKNTSVISKVDRKIVTDFEKTIDNKNVENIVNVSPKEDKSINSSYETIANIMIEEARRKREDIISKTFEEAQNIRTEAYEEGARQGYEEGYAAGYEKAVAEAQTVADQIVNNANSILLQATSEAANFLEEKKEEFMKLILTIAENTIRRELSNKNALNEMIYEAISYYKSFGTAVIRMNQHHLEEINAKIDSWKESLGLKADLFLIEDNSIEIGNAVIEKNNGKVIVGIDVALESIKDVLQ